MSLENFRKDNPPTGRPTKPVNARAYIATHVVELEQMESAGYTDEQMAAAVSANVTKPISALTFRRYLDDALRPVPVKARRLKKPKKPGDGSSKIIDHDPNEPLGRQPDIFDEDEDE